MDNQTRMEEFASMLDPVEEVLALERKAVVGLISEIVANVDIATTLEDGTTVYTMHLSPMAADCLAALGADQEVDPLDAGELDPLDAGEAEHDGREPEDEV